MLLPLLTGLSLGMECAGTTPNENMSMEEEPKVSFARDIQPLFTEHCIRCHVTGGFANNSGIPLRLLNGVSYDLLVNKKSAQDDSWYLVLPGDSAGSLLYHKVSSPNPPVGRMMPWDNVDPLSTEEVELIRTWIDEGAKNN